MQTAFSDQFFTVVIHDDAKRIEVVRSDMPFKEMPDLLKTVDSLIHAIEDGGARTYALLIDSRLAPAAKEGKHKDIFFMVARNLTARFARVAVVLQDSNSIESAKKNAREEVEFFCSLEDARAHLA